MEKICKKKSNFLDKDEICPIKMEKVRAVLKSQMSHPNYEVWDKNDEVTLMKDLAFRTIPEQYSDVQRMARYLYTDYIAWKFKGLSGIDKWKEEFNELLQEEIIE